jgi:hypothetical protein
MYNIQKIGTSYYSAGFSWQCNWMPVGSISDYWTETALSVGRMDVENKEMLPN